MKEFNQQEYNNPILPAIQQLNEYIFRILPVIKQINEEKTSSQLVQEYAGRFNEVKSEKDLLNLFVEFTSKSAKSGNQTAIRYIAPIIETKLSEFKEDKQYEKQLLYKDQEAKEVLGVMKQTYSNALINHNGRIIPMRELTETEEFNSLPPRTQLSLFQLLEKSTVKRETSVDVKNKKLYVSYLDINNEPVLNNSYDLIEDKDGIYYMKDDKRVYLDEKQMQNYQYQKNLIRENERKSLEESRAKISGEAIGEFVINNQKTKVMVNVIRENGIMSLDYYKLVNNKFVKMKEDEIQSLNKEEVDNLVTQAISKSTPQGRKLTAVEINNRAYVIASQRGLIEPSDNLAGESAAVIHQRLKKKLKEVDSDEPTKKRNYEDAIKLIEELMLGDNIDVPDNVYLN